MNISIKLHNKLQNQKEELSDIYKIVLAGKVGDPQTVRELLSMLDVLVDGRFVEEQKDLTLRFRGSANQRLIDVPKTLQTGKIVWWDESNEN